MKYQDNYCSGQHVQFATKTDWDNISHDAVVITIQITQIVPYIFFYAQFVKKWKIFFLNQYAMCKIWLNVQNINK